jgi:predicted phage terminase large subunit-like protein
VVVGQRVHEQDLTADWLEREGEHVHHLELPMEYSTQDIRPSQLEPCWVLGDKVHDPRTKDGELLAPQRFDRPTVEQLKVNLGAYAFSAQYAQRPSPRAGMVLNPAWFIDRPADFELGACDVVQAWDLNYSASDASDWTVAVTAAVEREGLGRIHILDVFAQHLGEERHEVALSEHIDIWRPLLVGIEKRAYEHQGATRDLVRRIERLIEHKRCYIEPVEADADKISRAQIIVGRAKSGHLSVDRKASWWHALSNEMARFPRSSHDDRVDALAYVVRLAVERLINIRALQLAMSGSVPVRQRGELVGGHRRAWDE